MINIKSINTVIFETSDGKKFFEQEQALEHQNKLNFCEAYPDVGLAYIDCSDMYEWLMEHKDLVSPLFKD